MSRFDGLAGRLGRFIATSVVTTATSQTILLGLSLGAPHLSPIAVALTATIIAVIPSYTLSRRWVWRRSGRSHLTREVLPFVGLALVGLVVSLGTVSLADHLTIGWSPHWHRAIAVDAAYLGGYALVWLGRFVALELVIFARRESR